MGAADADLNLQPTPWQLYLYVTLSRGWSNSEGARNEQRWREHSSRRATPPCRLTSVRELVGLAWLALAS